MKFNPLTAANFDLVSYHDQREKSEVRTDPEQAQALEKTLELLAAAGYFRARLGALSAFDRVLGGLAWAIQGSAVDVDVDVFFDDGATLGEKNKCSENVCRALLRMKCPHKLQSFQITRADWRQVHPVAVWLVRTVLESREDNEKQMRRLALFRAPLLAPDRARIAAGPAARARLAAVQTDLGPRRRFRQTAARAPTSETERVLNVLREYGTLGGAAGGAAGGDAGGLGESYASWAGKDNVSGSVVGGLMGMDELRRYRALYEEGRGSRPESEAQLAQRLHAQKVAALRSQLDQGSQELAKLRQQHSAGAQRLAAMLAALDQRRAANAALAEELENFRKRMAESEFAGTVRELQDLVALNETLKTHMSEFEESCRRQAEELRQKVLALRGGAEDDDETAYVARVEEAHKESKSKMAQLRAVAARKNRTVLLLERKLDEVPTHSELAQYGRMLVELYEQINSKFVETRKYYNSFNALDDTRRFLESELSILRSISTQYDEAMRSRSNKEAFVNSMQTIVGSVEQSYDKTRAKHQEESDRRDALHEEHVALLDKQREYAKLTKEFLAEAAKNAEYEARIQAAAASPPE